METLWIELVLIAVAILANGLFAGSEIALVSSRVSRLADMRKKGVRGAAAAFGLKESPEAFLATIQIAITLVGALASAVGGAAAIARLTPVLEKAPLPGASNWAEPLALGIVILVITYFSLVIGELTPKALALRDPERLACVMAPLVTWLTRVFAGVVRLLIVSTNLVLRVVGQQKAQESPFTSEEEVKYLIREGAAKGVFERTEEELVHNVFEFADTTVREVMVPHPSIKGIDITTPAAEVPRLAATIGHSRIPVYRGHISHPVGILLMRDVLSACAEGRMPPIAEMVRPPLFVPEMTKISTVLRALQRQRQDMALVVDEHGNVVGLIAIRDIVEEIVGDIRDESDPNTPQIVRVPDGALIVDGLTPIDEVRATGVPVEDSPDYTTAAGFVITALGAIAPAGASVTHSGYRWTVIETDGPRLRKLRIERA